MGESVAEAGGKPTGVPHQFDVRVPNPIDGVDDFVGYFGESGLCKVTALGRSFQDDPQGITVRGEADRLADEVTLRYGSATHRSVAASGSADDYSSFALQLHERTRLYDYRWTPAGGDIADVWVEASATESLTTYVTVAFEFENYPDCRREWRDEDASKF